MTSWIPYGHQVIDEEDIDAVVRTLSGDWLTTGPAVKQFEMELASRVGSRYAVAFNSGTAALHAAYFAAGVRAGDEVVTSPLTFAATANAALYLGATPVFVDIQPDTGNIDPDKVRNVLSERTRVIAPVDYAGHPADLNEILEIAHDIGAVVVEDACHALGASYRGDEVGSISDMTVFSFHPVKHVTTGEGGAVTTESEEFFQRLLLFRNHGITKDTSAMSCNPGPWYYEMQELGYNYRITDIQCALGVSQLRKLERFIVRRDQIVKRYNEAFEDFPLFIPGSRVYTKPAWHLYPSRISVDLDRRRVVERLHGLGIGVQVHYIPVYKHPYYQRHGFSTTCCPEAEAYYNSELSLPLHPGLTEAEVDKVIESIKTVLCEEK